ncbi:MAG: beta-propeller fold lactonase family protein [Hyalangium sp.]|uniref:beta-propeller fold lactonase family protein n=1 Tax=Hyalangium sp. TaxID=2028555 RepID=UPI00389A369F
MTFIRRGMFLWGLLSCLFVSKAAHAAGSFVNWESPHVHPLDMTPDGERLLAVNTAASQLMVFELTGNGHEPRLVASIPVGLEPVSVRARPNSMEAWVVNQLSDTVSIVNLDTLNVVATVPTDDEPADVVFAGAQQRAFISCSQSNTVLVVDPDHRLAPPQRVPVLGERPRALAVSPDHLKVYAAIFESGNGSTVLGGGSTFSGLFPPNVVSNPTGPYGGINPPPNKGNSFEPRINPLLTAPPGTSLIVKKNELNRWMDDNAHDWTDWVSGPNASASHHLVGWDLPDRDLAIIDTATLAVTYATGLMNINMALAVRPGGGITVVGTDATNEVRFEPNLNGRFLRVVMAEVSLNDPSQKARWDLNPHLTYTTPTVPPAERKKSIGDPRAIVWDHSGQYAYVAGMGSNNVVVMKANGEREAQLDVGEGPTGLVLDEDRGQLYVLNRFAASISVVELDAHPEKHRYEEKHRVAYFDPTPAVIKVGRKHLYDTHKNSGLGHISCASCHVDGRMDRLAWDLGDPTGQMAPQDGQNKGMGIPPLLSGFVPVHPMKGPMTTQTLQDIIGKEALHWRGDRNGLEDFNPAFESLQGNDTLLTAVEMQQFKDFLATLTFPPNPFRNLDNSLSTNVPLPGHFTPGRFAPEGQPMPNGNAQHGLKLFGTIGIVSNAVVPGVACSSCHTLPTGLGTDMTWDVGLARFVPLPRGPHGENHVGLVTTDQTTNVVIKIPQLRNLYKKVGADITQPTSLAGFGFIHDGSVDSIERFLTNPAFHPADDQEIADLVAFLLSFSGSDLPAGSVTNIFNAPGPLSQDTHAAVGKQVTLSSTPSDEQKALLDRFLAMADTNKVGLVVKGRQGRHMRGYAYLGGGEFQSDRASERLSTADLLLRASPGNELTWTVVAKGTEWRLGMDQNEDGVFDQDDQER